MRCDICGKESAQVKKISRIYGKGNNLFIIQNIPITICNNCGESYLTAKTLHEIDRIKRQKKNLSRKKNVAIAQFV